MDFNISKDMVPAALKFLHTIGDVAYFGDDPTEGMYHLLCIYLFKIFLKLFSHVQGWPILYFWTRNG